MNDDLEAQMLADAEQAAAPVGDRLERLHDLAMQLRLAQVALYEADCALERCEKLERKLRETDIPELMKECGMKEFKFTDGTKIAVQPDLKCGITKENQAQAFAWLRDHGLGGIIARPLEVPIDKGPEGAAEAVKAAEALKAAGFDPTFTQSVHWQTLKSAIREEREKGKHVPPELFSLHEYETTKIDWPAGVEKPKKPRAKK